MERLKKAIKFLKTDIWRIKIDTLKGPRFFWIKQLRILLLAVRGFDENRCQLHASALTFLTILSIVPIVATAFGIAKGFGLHERFEKLLIEKLPQEEVVNYIITFSRSLLENTQGGVIAGIGVVFLFWTVIRLLGNIEKAFNEIWGVQRGRSLSRKFSDYLSIMLICPFLLIISSSLTVLIAGRVSVFVQGMRFWGVFENVIMTALVLLPYGVVWLLLSLIFILMPNTKVKFQSAAWAAILSGTTYQIVQWFYVNFQINVSRMNAIYGSFAALPLFLLWVQLSWIIVLFGAEISFAEQNVKTYEFEPDCLKVSYSFKQLMALSVAQICIKRFSSGKPALNAQQIATALDAPIRLVNLVVFNLAESGVLCEVKREEDESIAYHPARDTDDLTIALVLEQINKKGEDHIPFEETVEIRKIRQSLAEFKKIVEGSPHNLKLKDI